MQKKIVPWPKIKASYNRRKGERRAEGRSFKIKGEEGLGAPQQAQIIFHR